MWVTSALLICAVLSYNECKYVRPSAPELKFVFVAVRGAAHWPCDYPEGPTIFGRPENNSRLSWRGRNDAYNYGQEIGKMYKSKLGINNWNKNTYWSVASTSPRTVQAALVLGAGMESKYYKKNKKWSSKEKKYTQFTAIYQYIKFYHTKQCPRYLQEVRSEMRKTCTNFPKLEFALKVFNKKLAHNTLHFRDNAHHIWLAYESMYNVFYSYQRRYSKEFKYWKRVQGELKEFSKQLMWTALTANENLRKMASGPMVTDVMNDIEVIKKGKAQPDAPGQEQTKITIMSAPQGILAAAVAGFAPEGTKIGGKRFTADHLYPEHGAMVILELYKQENEWKIKILYRKKWGECLEVMELPGCHSTMCEYRQFKKAIKNNLISENDHHKLCRNASD